MNPLSAKIVETNHVVFYTKRMQKVANSFRHHRRTTQIVFDVLGGFVLLKIGITHNWSNESRGILDAKTVSLGVGTVKGKMEMEKVPKAGFEIIGLPISGIQRKLSPKNLLSNLCVQFKVLYSRAKAKKIIRQFRPDIAIGVGGFASAPLLSAAVKLHVPCLIQEQNGFAGLTNKMLGKDVDCICVAYEGMEKFFPKEKIVLSGNPIRSCIVPATPEMKAAAIKHSNHI